MGALEPPGADPHLIRLLPVFSGTPLHSSGIDLSRGLLPGRRKDPITVERCQITPQLSRLEAG